MQTLPLTSEDKKVIFNRPSTQVKHFKESMRREYIIEKVVIKIMETSVVATINNMIMKQRKQ